MSIVPAGDNPVAHLGVSVHRATPGGQIRTTTRTGAIAVDLTPRGVDRARRVARYELRVANETALPLAAFAYAVKRKTNEPPVTCLALAVRAHSAVLLGFEVALLRRTTFERVAVEIRGDDILLTVDALPPPPIPEFPRRIFGLAGAALVAAAAIAFALERPRIVGLSVPNVALAGSRIDAVYAARGNGRLRYELDGSDGTVLGGGTLDHRDGSFPLALAAGASRTYVVRLAIEGALGSDVRVATVESQRRPVARTVTRVEHPARIASLAVEHDRVVADAPIVVYYDIDAAGGTIRLLDRNGVAWGGAPVNRGAGSVRLNAPSYAQPRELSVALRAVTGASRAESSVGVLVLPKTSPSPSASPKPSPSRPAPTPEPNGIAFPAISRAPFSLPSRPVHAGDTVRIGIVTPRNGLRLAVTAPDGHDVINELVGDRREIALRLPGSPRNTRYTVVATFNRGYGEETMVRELHVAP